MSSLDTLMASIPGPSRVGTYLRYDPLYDQIKEARREDLDVPQGEWQQTLKKADWPLVVRLAGEALATKSKDIQLAAWLTEALLRQEGFPGLQRGLDLIRGLIEEFWDDLYPELEDGDAELRAVPLEWLGGALPMAIRSVPLNRAGHNLVDYVQAARIPTEEEADGDDSKYQARKSAIDEGKLTPEEFYAELEATPKAWYKELVESIGSSVASLQELERTADERFGADAPNLIKLRDALREAEQTAGQLLAKKLAADPDPVEVFDVVSDEEVAPLEASSEGSAPPSAAAQRPVAGPRNLDEASAQIAAAARLLRSRAPADPAPYLMLRGYRWGELRRGGEGPDPRLLEAPPTELRASLKQLLLDERWAELLEAGEAIMAAPYGRGWLDLQRYAVSACDALGGDFEALAAALRSALRQLLLDVPQLPTLALLDDTPAANTETQAWLRAERLLAAPAGSEPAADPASAPAGRGPYARALGLVRQGEIQRAVELLVHEAGREPSSRGRFLRRTEAASVLVDAGLESVAQPILNELLAHIETHRLEEWEEGATVALPLVLAYRCIAASSPEHSSLEELYLRICRLDPLQAIQLHTVDG